MTALLTLTGLTILLGTIVVLDPFMGSGTTGKMAVLSDRDFRGGVKMLNVEKYLGVIKSEIGENACASKSCLIAKVRRSGAKQDCNRITCRDCEDESIEWLFSEYEPPLLENGDSLKPGDWIMVRYYTADNWHKRQFMCFYNGVFYTAEGAFDMVGHHTFSRWHDARLPEDGE